MRILQIDDSVREDIAKLKKYAAEHIVDEHYLKLLKSGDMFPIGDNENHFMYIHDGYRIAYSVDKSDNGKLYHHISISVEAMGKAPNEYAVNMILEEFGLKPYKESDGMYLEDNAEALNILQEKIDGKG